MASLSAADEGPAFSEELLDLYYSKSSSTLMMFFFYPETVCQVLSLSRSRANSTNNCGPPPESERLFPYEHMFRWMSYGNDPDDKENPNVVKDFFYRREWSFTLAGGDSTLLLIPPQGFSWRYLLLDVTSPLCIRSSDDIYIRYNCFHTAAEMKAAMVSPLEACLLFATVV